MRKFGKIYDSTKNSLAGILLGASLAVPLMGQQELPSVKPSHYNIVNIVLDDVGYRDIGGNGGIDVANTPTLDSLVNQGMYFSKFYTYPLCSPTRAAFLTGRHAGKVDGRLGTGIGKAINSFPGVDDGNLSHFEFTLPEAIMHETNNAYNPVCFGKLHEASVLGPSFGFDHARRLGFDDRFSVFRIGNFTGRLNENYFNFHNFFGGSFLMNINGIYEATDLIDYASFVVSNIPEPFYMHLSFNSAHHPFELPPNNLHTRNIPNPQTATDREKYLSMIEAVDTELRRFLGHISPEVRERTYFFVWSDNGPNEDTIDHNKDNFFSVNPSHVKGTQYEGGIKTPLIVCGPGVVPGSRCDALVNVRDLFNTHLDIATNETNHSVEAVIKRSKRSDDPAFNSMSIVPYFDNPNLPSIRKSSFVERFKPNNPSPNEIYFHHMSVVGFKDVLGSRREFKLINTIASFNPPQLVIEELYDIVADERELSNLLRRGVRNLSPEIRRVYDELKGELLRHY